MTEKPFTNHLIKSEIKAAMKRADSSEGEYEFLSALTSIRNRAVHITKVVTDDEFDELCQEVLDESEDDNNG